MAEDSELKRKDNFVWVDMEMTGLNPNKEVIIEIATIITDKNLNILRCFHLLIINFLNTYGHTYQKTDDEKINKLTAIYKGKIKIKNFPCMIKHLLKFKTVHCNKNKIMRSRTTELFVFLVLPTIEN